MIALVALVREPVLFDPAVIAKMAGRAWKADLGDGSAEGADGFVVGQGPSILQHGSDHYLLNSFATPYVDDPEGVAESIVDLRIRRLFTDHRGWFSIDALSIDKTTPTDEITACYARLGKLMVELLDKNCLLIYVPETSRAFPVTEETERALLADDPLAALQESLPVPMTQVAADDPLMKDAVAQARQDWPKFVAAFEANAGESFSAKGPISHSGNTEFIWLAVTAVEGERIFGTLANEPANLGPLKLGSKVMLPLEKLNDWCFVDSHGEMQGGFTIAAVAAAARRQQKS